MTHFPDAEFRCRCGRPICPAPAAPDPALRSTLEIARAFYGGPIVVTSGNRCEYWNRQQGGETPSEHVQPGGCLGADLSAPTSRTRWLLLRACLDAGITRVGVYARHLHVGVGTAPAFAPAVLWTR